MSPDGTVLGTGAAVPSPDAASPPPATDPPATASQPSRYSWALPRTTGPYLTGTAGSARLTGIDAARGLALLGMVVAHIGTTSCGLTSAEGLVSLAHGRSSVLFAVIAGFSLGILSGRATPHSGQRLVRTRLRVLVRCALLLVLGALCTLLDTPVAIILGFYAAWLALALPFVGLPARALLALSGVIALIGPVLIIALPWALADLGLTSSADDGNAAVLSFFVYGTYPGLLWMAYIFLGLGLSRLEWGRSASLWRLAGAGALCAVLGYGGAVAAGHALGVAEPDRPILVSPADPMQCEQASDGASQPPSPSLRAPVGGAVVQERSSDLEPDPALVGLSDEVLASRIAERSPGASAQEVLALAGLEAAQQSPPMEVNEYLRRQLTALQQDSGEVLPQEGAPGAKDGSVTDPGPGVLVEPGYGPLDSSHWSALVTARPHSNTTFEALGSGGVAMLVIALAQLIATRARMLLAPLAAVGSMSLTVYCAHLVLIHAAGLRPGSGHDVTILVCLSLVLAAMTWFKVFARGPLEHVVHVISLRATRAR